MLRDRSRSPKRAQEETDYKLLDSKAASGQRKRWQSWAFLMAALLATSLLVLFASTSGARGVVSTMSPFLTSVENEVKAKTLSELLAKTVRKKHAGRRLQGNTFARKLKVKTLFAYQTTLADIRAAPLSVNSILSAPAPAKVKLSPKLHNNLTCRTDDTRTRILVSLPCSGSGFVYGRSLALAKLHGYCFPFHFEPFHPKLEGITRTHKEWYEEIRRNRDNGVPYAYKEPKLLHSVEVFRKHQESDKLVMVHVYRSNTFDFTCCLLNDCFFKSLPKDSGYAVYLNGTRSNLCFQRRLCDGQRMAFATQKKDCFATLEEKGKDVKTQVYLNTKDLSSLLNRFSMAHIQKHNKLKNLGCKFESIAYEDLAAYQVSWKPEDLDKSVQAWTKFMKSWGIAPDMKLIENYLKKEQGSRLPGPKREKIYNYDAVVAALKGSALIRMLD